MSSQRSPPKRENSGGKRATGDQNWLERSAYHGCFNRKEVKDAEAACVVLDLRGRNGFCDVAHKLSPSWNQMHWGANISLLPTKNICNTENMFQICMRAHFPRISITLAECYGLDHHVMQQILSLFIEQKRSAPKQVVWCFCVQLCRSGIRDRSLDERRADSAEETQWNIMPSR